LAKLAVEAPLDALFPLLFGAIAAPLAGLNPRRRGAFLGTLALQAVAASSLGLSVSALAPTTESALAAGPCLMVLSIMLADSGGMFAEVPTALQPLAKLSIVKWGFEGALCAEFPGLSFDTPPVDKRAPPAMRAAAAALGVRRGEEVLARMRLPAAGGVGAAARMQLRAAGASLLLTYAALRCNGGAMAAAPQPWDATLTPPL
jgi:hypothetical protein